MPEVTVLYDGQCELCRGSVARVQRLDRRHRIEFLDLHDSTVAARFPQVDHQQAMLAMQAITASGQVTFAADAWAAIFLTLPGWRWLGRLLQIPGIRRFARRFYGWVARNRYRWNRQACTTGTCALHGSAPTQNTSNAETRNQSPRDA